MSNQTTLQIECAYCKRDMGTKDGHGTTGPTGGICPECLEIEIEKFNKRVEVRNEQRR